VLNLRGEAAGGALDEASLDTQQALGATPGTRFDLYLIPNLATQNVIDGHAGIVDANLTDLVCSSYGGCELQYTATTTLFRTRLPGYNGVVANGRLGVGAPETSSNP